MKKLFIFFLASLSITSAFSQPGTPIQHSGSKPFVLGEIREIESAILAEKRILNIYLPAGYKAGDTTKYPVIYLLDGSADEDFIHIAGLVQFNSFEWVNRLPKSIVVGIATVDRKRDFTFPTSIEADKKKYPSTGQSARFIDFIDKELQPFIQSAYKINSSKTLIGQSLGGLLATEILFKKPYLFNKYIIVSPSLWWNNGSLLNDSSLLSSQNIKDFTQVYISAGKEGLTPTTLPRMMEVDANLLAEKIRSARIKNVRLEFDYLPQEDHATILHQAVLNAFKWMY